MLDVHMLAVNPTRNLTTGLVNIIKFENQSKIINFDSFLTWKYDFSTARVDAILADVLILKNDAFWSISKTCFENVLKVL